MLYISETDHKYLMGLQATLSDRQREIFEGNLIAAISRKNGGEGMKNTVKILPVGDLLAAGVGAPELVTRTLIKKVYREAKHGY